MEGQDIPGPGRYDDLRALAYIERTTQDMLRPRTSTSHSRLQIENSIPGPSYVPRDFQKPAIYMKGRPKEKPLEQLPSSSDYDVERS